MNIKVNPDVKVQGSRLTFESSVTKLYGCLIRTDLVALGGGIK